MKSEERKMSQEEIDKENEMNEMLRQIEMMNEMNNTDGRFVSTVRESKLSISKAESDGKVRKKSSWNQDQKD